MTEAICPACGRRGRLYEQPWQPFGLRAGVRVWYICPACGHSGRAFHGEFKTITGRSITRAEAEARAAAAFGEAIQCG